jgi:hypothetical protein
MTASTARTRFKNSVVVHDTASSGNETLTYGDRVDVTLTLEDGRTVQVGVLNNGHVMLRAWAGNPYATSNLDSCSVSFTLPTLEDQILDGKPVSDLNVRTSTPTARSLPSPVESDGTWHVASQAIRERVQGIRALLALRSPADANQ